MVVFVVGSSPSSCAFAEEAAANGAAEAESLEELAEDAPVVTAEAETQDVTVEVETVEVIALQSETTPE